MRTPDQVYDACCRAACVPGLAEWDGWPETRREHVARQPAAARRALERAARFAELLSEPRCLDALLEAKTALLNGGRR